MTVAQQDYTIEQGEDDVWSITYTIDGVPIDSSWQARMDIGPAGSGGGTTASLWSFNSADFTDGVDDNGQPLDLTGVADNEITISDEGQIDIEVSRTLTLPGGKLGDRVAQGVTEFSYDLFVRDGDGGRQTKIMAGKISVNRSVTKWA